MGDAAEKRRIPSDRPNAKPLSHWLAAALVDRRNSIETCRRAMFKNFLPMSLAPTRTTIEDATRPTANNRSKKLDSKRFYLPELDALRFFAFLAVFLCHATVGVPGFVPAVLAAGGYGVDLFFLLSSFLITSLLIREHEKTGRIDVPAFWIRRSLRIWPLYFAFVAAVGFAYPLIDPPQAIERHHAIGLLTFTQNWTLVIFGISNSRSTNILWSISLEEQFYISWPVILWIFGMARLRTIAWSMFALSFLSRVIAIHFNASDAFLWNATPVRLEPIAIGALMAIPGRRPKMTTTLQRVVLVALAAIILIAVRNITAEFHWKWLGVLAFPLVAIACAFALHGVIGSGWRLLSAAPLVYLGRISYGLYVFHLFAIHIASRIAPPSIPLSRTVTAFLLTVGLAALSYRYLEKPFLRLKDQFARVQSRPP